MGDVSANITNGCANLYVRKSLAPASKTGSVRGVLVPDSLIERSRVLVGLSSSFELFRMIESLLLVPALINPSQAR
jgi:hypothetical protein